MYGTSFDGYLVHQRNEEILREVRTARLARRLRANRQYRSAGRRTFWLLIQAIRSTLLGDAAAERTPAAG